MTMLPKLLMAVPDSPVTFHVTHRDGNVKWLPIVKANHITLD